jgi:hypothetical protein
MSSRLKSFLMKAAFIFEPLAAPFISYYLKRTLSDWKKEGRIDDYRVQTTRIKKYHYTIALDLDVTPRQTQRVFHQSLCTLDRKVKEVRSWLKTKVGR